jgi:hypothetical protein
MTADPAIPLPRRKLPIGLDIVVEDTKGRIDMTVLFGSAVWLFEFEFSKADRNIVGFEVETLGAAPPDPAAQPSNS